MVLKKKLRVRDLLLAALVILLCVGVPIWMLIYVLITGSVVWGVAMIAYVWVAYFIARRFDHV
jgi:hypothetical protein